MWVGVVSTNTLVGLVSDAAFFLLFWNSIFYTVCSYFEGFFGACYSKALHNENIIICSTSETFSFFADVIKSSYFSSPPQPPVTHPARLAALLHSKEVTS